MIRTRTIVSLALLASLAACGGHSSSPTTAAATPTPTPTPTPAPKATPSPTPTPTPTPSPTGSTNFANPSVVMNSTGTATLAADATSQSVTMQDGAVADANSPGGLDHKDLIVVNVNAGGVTFVGPGSTFCKTGTSCTGAGHVFDVTNDVNGDPNNDSAPGTVKNGVPIGFTGNGRPTLATANFPNDNFFLATATDGSNATLTFDGSLNFSVFGIWEAPKDDKGNGPVFGAFATAGEGQAATQFSALPKGTTAQYTGNAIGVALKGGNVTHLDGTTALNADFTKMQVSGTVTYNNAATGAAFTQLNLAPGTIVQGAGGAAVWGNSVQSTDKLFTGTAQGSFYGPAAQEAAGTLTAAGQGTTIVGAFGGARK